MADREQTDEQANGTNRGTKEQREEIHRRQLQERGGYGEGSPGGYGASRDAGRGTIRGEWDRGADDRAYGGRDAPRDFGRGENVGSSGPGAQTYGNSGGFGQGGNPGGSGTGGYTGGYGSSGAWGGQSSGASGGFGAGQPGGTGPQTGGQGQFGQGQFGQGNFGQGQFGQGQQVGQGQFGQGRGPEYTGGLQEHRGYGSSGEYGGGSGRPDWNPSSTSGGGTPSASQGGPPVAGAYGLHTLMTHGATFGRGEVSDERGRGRDTGRWIREGALVRDVMTKDVKTVHPDATVAEAARLMREEETGIIPVVSDGRVAGVVTDRDLAIRVLAEGKDPTTCKVSDVMTDDVHVITADDRLVDAVRIMGEENVRRLPVVDRDDRLRGVLSMSDVAREAELDYALQEALERIAARRSFWTRW